MLAVVEEGVVAADGEGVIAVDGVEDADADDELGPQSDGAGVE